jgi:LacI family transcriptional regulator
MLAVGVIEAAAELAIRVPEDLVVIGYDDNRLAAESAVTVSSISQRGHHMAETAVGLLLDELDRSADHRHRTVEVPPHLVPRRSSLRRPVGEPRLM